MKLKDNEYNENNSKKQEIHEINTILKSKQSIPDVSFVSQFFAYFLISHDAIKICFSSLLSSTVI